MPIAPRHGYQCVTAVVNSSHWVPQHRERFYAVLVATPFVPIGFDLQALIPRSPRVCSAQTFRSWINSVSQSPHWITIAAVKLEFRTSHVFQRIFFHKWMECAYGQLRCTFYLLLAYVPLLLKIAKSHNGVPAHDAFVFLSLQFCFRHS